MRSLSGCRDPDQRLKCGMSDSAPEDVEDAAAAANAPWFIAGPTASGKSALAAALAELCQGEVVNDYAFQLYRGLPLLTAQPEPAELARAPHHLFAVLAPTERTDAAAYAALARPVIDDIRARARRPIVVGGSGLYLKALTHGLPERLPLDPGLRRELSGWTAGRRRDELLARDPAAAGMVDLANDRYVSRALELVMLTGKPLAEARPPFAEPRPGIRALVLQRQVEELDQRIRVRCRRMIDSGLVEEVRLAEREGVSATLAKAIGYQACLEHLQGVLELDELLERLRLDTRRYAKRQRTWFRREPLFKPLPAEPGETTTSLAQKAIEILRHTRAAEKNFTTKDTKPKM